MARLFNVLNFSIHCKIIFISHQNNCVYVLLKYIKSLGSPQRLLFVLTGIRCLGEDLAFHLLVVSFSRKLFIFGRCENRSEYVVDIKEGCWIFLIVYERKVKKPDYSEVRIESFDQFLGENARSPVKKFISVRSNRRGLLRSGGGGGVTSQ